MSLAKKLLSVSTSLRKFSQQKEKTYEEWLEAVKQDGRRVLKNTLHVCTLSRVPKELRTLEICLVAVKQDGRALKWVPPELRTPELCLIAVKQNGDALDDVPPELRTPELCLEAVKQNGLALQVVPEELRTPKLCLEAVKQNGEALQWVPPELKTLELCLEAVKENGWALQVVPEELRTPKLCLEAVKQNGEALFVVPKELRTPELCLEAVKQNGLALRAVPKELRTPELCLEAVKQNGWALRDVPLEMKEKLRDFAILSINEREEVRNQESKEQRKTSPENLQSQIKHSSLTQLMFDVYSLNFLHSEKADDPQLVDFLWKEGLIKIKKKYSSFLLKELKEEVKTTSVPMVLKDLPHPSLEVWYKYATLSTSTEELDCPFNWSFDKSYLGKATLDDYINLFAYSDWEEGYGGMAWAKIAYYTKKLSETSNPQEIMHIVDTINHLAHNSGNILNKWIKDPEVLLDAKAHKESLRIMYPFCSPDVKSLLRDYFRNHLRSAMSRLRLVLAQQNTQLEAKLLEAGFPSLEEAIRCARIYRELVDEYTKFCGPLIRETKVYDKIKEQLPEGQVSFHFRDKKNLGRMRALVRLVCLRHGYVPLFTRVDGVSNFEIAPQTPLNYDTYGTLYSVTVVPISRPTDGPNARAFYSLDQQTRRQLLALAH